MTKPFQLEKFEFASNDPFAEEHASLATWVEASIAGKSNQGQYIGVDLKSHPTGQQFLDLKPEQARRHALAAVEQARHWNRMMNQVRDQGRNEMERINSHQLPGWGDAWIRYQHVEAVVSALMRRALPLEERDLLTITKWCSEGTSLSTYFIPIGHIVRSIQRYAKANPIEGELREALQKLAAQLRSSRSKDERKLGTQIEQLCVDKDAVLEDEGNHAPASPTPTPSVAGSPVVLQLLKQNFGLTPQAEIGATRVIELDQFALPFDSPLQTEHDLVTKILEEAVSANDYYNITIRKLPIYQTLLQLSPQEIGRLSLAAAERHVYSLLNKWTDFTQRSVWQSRACVSSLVRALLDLPFELSRDELFDLIVYLSSRPKAELVVSQPAVATLIAQVEGESKFSPLTEGERYILHLFRTALIVGPPLGSPSDEVKRLTNLIDDRAVFFLVPCEAWSDAVNHLLAKLPASERQKWSALLTHTMTATSARPSAKWLKTATNLVNEIGGDQVQKSLADLLPFVARDRTAERMGAYSGDSRGAADVMDEENANCLRGLLWLVQLLPKPNDLAREVTAVAISAYKKVPGVGPRASKVGNAAVYALSELGTPESVGQLAMLKVRVKFGSAQKEIEKAFNAAAEALSLPRDQIEEMGVPSYGLEEVGFRHEQLGDYRADLIVTGSDAELRWFDPNGKSLKSVPAKVKTDHAEDLKELKQSLKDIQSMLPAQRDRIDSMYLLQKSWPIDVWRER